MTKIEWTHIPGFKGETWNPVTGCTKTAQGCKNCYAEGVAKRFWGDRKFTDVQTHPDRLDQPLRWRKPRCVFVNSMSDLFHEDVSFEFIAAVYGVMAASPDHLFLILTKRPERMLEFFERVTKQGHVAPWDFHARYAGAFQHRDGNTLARFDATWPIKNAWHGVSVATQADKPLIDILRGIPSAKRFISAEPQIEDLGDLDLRDIDWVIQGGESGHDARPFDIAWARSMRDQCKAAGVKYFLKQVGGRPYRSDDEVIDGEGRKVAESAPTGWFSFPGGRVQWSDRKGGDPAEWPEDFRDCRAWPEVACAKEQR